MSNQPYEKKWLFIIVFIALSLVVYYGGSALTPFIISLIIAYTLDPLVDKIETYGLPRTVAILFFLAFLLVIFAGGFLVLIPVIKLQVEAMAKSLPGYVQTAQSLIAPLIAMVSKDPENIRALAQENMLKLGNLPLKVLSSVLSFSWNAFSGFLNFTMAALKLAVIPVATFYLLRDIDKLKERTIDLIPLDMKDNVLHLAEKIHLVLGNFVRGQLTVALILATIYSVGLFLVGIPLSLPIGLLAGLASIVPYLGLILGLLPSVVLGYLQFHDIVHPLLVCLVFGVAQGFEGMVITPKIVGEKLGLHPVVIMLAVLLGGQLFGFTGILLGVPVAAAINVFWMEGLKVYKQSEMYLGAGGQSKHDEE